MLVLSRKKGQAVNIGGNIKIIIADIQNDQVKIGIEAPQDVDIFRAEIYQAVQNENKNALAKRQLIKLLQQNHKKQ